MALWQLRELGLSASAARSRVAAGRLHTVYRGVYAVGRARLDLRGRRIAGVLACGPGAVLSHRAAADEQSLLRSTSGLVDVTIPSRSGRGRPGIRVHRSRRLRPEDCTTVHGIPCTTADRTLLDLAAVVSAATLGNAIEAAERLRVFDLGAVTEQLERAAGRPEATRLHAALAAYQEPPPSRNDFERLAFELFARAGLPKPGVNALVDTAAEQLEVDFCWPNRRLIVEADGWDFHRTRAAFERDRRRDLLLRAAGWTVIRITWRQLTRGPDEILAAVAASRAAAPPLAA